MLFTLNRVTVNTGNRFEDGIEPSEIVWLSSTPALLCAFAALRDVFTKALRRKEDQEPARKAICNEGEKSSSIGGGDVC